MSANDLIQSRAQAKNKRSERTQLVDIEKEQKENEELLIAVGNTQDREAFNMLFHRFASKIYALGMKITRNEQLANDLVQEAMLIIWQKAPLLFPIFSLLARIAIKTECEFPLF